MARKELTGNKYDEVDGGVIRLSHSSASLILNCERRYFHKIKETEPDPDYQDDGKALRIGKGFHKVLEDTRHDPSKMQPKIFHHAMVDEGVKGLEERGLILAMLQSYYPLHTKSKLNVLACEIEVGDKHTVGYVDAVMGDDKGNWYLVDNKTAGRLSGDLSSRLRHDPQLRLYSFYAPEVASALKLKKDKFQGCHYRVTTKATAKIKADESPEAYARRIAHKVESFNIGIPHDEAIVKATRDRHERLHERATAIKDAAEKSVMQNFNGCFNYFRPCPYWSRCHGATFTEASESLEIVEAKDMTPTKPMVESAKSDFDVLDLF